MRRHRVQLDAHHVTRALRQRDEHVGGAPDADHEHPGRRAQPVGGRLRGAGEEAERGGRAVHPVEKRGGGAVERQHALLDGEPREDRAHVSAELRRQARERLRHVDASEAAPAGKGDGEPARLGGARENRPVLVGRDVHGNWMERDEAAEQHEVEHAHEQRRAPAGGRRCIGAGGAGGCHRARRGDERDAPEPGHARDRERAPRSRADQVGEVEPVHVGGIGRERPGDAEPEEEEGHRQERIREQEHGQAAQRAEDLLRGQVDCVDCEERRHDDGGEGDQRAREMPGGMRARRSAPCREQRARRSVAK